MTYYKYLISISYITNYIQFNIIPAIFNVSNLIKIKLINKTCKNMYLNKQFIILYTSNLILLEKPQYI